MFELNKNTFFQFKKPKFAVIISNVPKRKNIFSTETKISAIAYITNIRMCV